MKKGKGKNSKDLEGPFEAMKQFKADFPETENDIAFKTAYTRLRKFVKKLKKIYETEDKAKTQKEMKEDQREMISTKKDNEMLFDEVLLFCNSYMKAYRERAEAGGDRTQNEDEKKDDQETQKSPPQPEIDIQAIREEEFDRGYSEGKKAGYDEGHAAAYDKGRQDGYSQAQADQPPQQEQDPADVLRKAAKFATVFMVLPTWLSAGQMLDPNSKLTDYFTEAEINQLRQLFSVGQPYFSPQFDFKKVAEPGLVEALDRATGNSQFQQNVNLAFPMTAAYMMSFGAFNPAFGAPAMMGNPMGQPMPMGMPGIPNIGAVTLSQPSAMQQQEVVHQVQHNETPIESHSEPIGSAPQHQSYEFQAEETVGAQNEAADEEGKGDNAQADPSQDIWRHADDDEDDDEEAELDHDSHEDEPSASPEHATPDQPADAEQAQPEGDGRGFHSDKPRGHKSGRYRHPRGSRYQKPYNKENQYYEGYNEKDYELYEKQYGRAQRNYHGRYNYNQDYAYDNEQREYQGSGNEQPRDYYGKHRSSRGGPRKFARGRGKEELVKDVKKEQPKEDDDGFAIVNKKTYNMPSRKGKKMRGT